MVDIARPDLPVARRRRQLMLGGAALVLLVVVSVALSRLQPAAPIVERTAVWIDTVKRGPFVREIRGTGTLVPEDLRWIPAGAEGRVERIRLHPGARVEIDGTIEIERLADVVFVGRPAVGEEGATIQLFRLDGTGHARRVPVTLGRVSASAVEIRSGLLPGDQVILSDMSQWDGVDRVRLK